MGTIGFDKSKIDVLEDAISAEGEAVVFEQHEIEKSGRDYLLACSKNDKDERAHRAEVLKEASRIVLF